MKEVLWDHYPSAEELAELVIDPDDQQDQFGHRYRRMIWSVGAVQTAICSCCERDFITGGYRGQAPRGNEVFPIIVCEDHVMARSMMDEEMERETAARD